MVKNMSVSIKLEGVEEYLEKLSRAGANIEKVAAMAVEESAKPIHEDIKKWAKKHERTGAAYEGVIVPKAKNTGGKISAQLGIESTEANKDAWHIVFVEYGTPRVAPDPGIRRAFSKNKAKVKRIQKKILEMGGIHLD